LRANDGITLASAKSYTDSANTFLQANDGITLASAKSYTDAKNTFNTLVTVSNDLIVSGNLTIQGTTTTLNSTTIRINDKNIELANVSSPTNTTADGGGITVIGATNKTFNWVNSTGAWASSENLDLASGKNFSIGGVIVLTGSTLSSNVTGSSLTSVGTITSGIWNAGTVTASQLTSTVATGSAPFIVTSNTVVTNLNADLLDGLSSSDLKAYTDSVVSSNNTSLTTAYKSYTDSVVSSNNTTLKAYTDSVVSSNNTSLRANDGITLASAKSYTDSVVSSNNTSLTTAYKSYTDSVVSSNNTTLKAYTDSVVSSNNTTLRTYISSAYNQANTKVYTFYQNTAPASSNSHDQWMNSDTGVMYENISGTTPIWVEFGPTGLMANSSPGIVAATSVNTVTLSASSNVTTSQLIVNYSTNSTNNVAVMISSANTFGGTGYADVLKLTNLSGGATNPNKYIRLNSTGAVEIINSAYSATLFNLSDVGNLSVAGDIQIAGKKAVNGPAFRAWIDTGQTIVQGAQRKVTFGTETFDTDNCFATSKFIPNVEGYYQLNATVRINGTSGTGEVMIILYKNGSEYARGTNESGIEQGNNFYSMQVSDIAYANGSTDNFEIYIQQTSGADRTTTAGQTISYFSGSMIRGA
jgi:hypothetical protein